VIGLKFVNKVVKSRELLTSSPGSSLPSIVGEERRRPGNEVMELLE